MAASAAVRRPLARRPSAVRLVLVLAAAAAAAGGDAVNEAATAAVDLDRPPLGRALVEELFVGREPFAVPPGEAALAHRPDKEMTHLARKDINMVLEFAPQPLTLWVELGSYEGGSAIRTAEQVHERAAKKGMLRPETTVLAVDTFLGDLFTLWARTASERRGLLRDDGSVSLYDRFRANVWASNRTATILPLHATSVVALKLLRSLWRRGLAPQPQVIYLDSAHEEGEVLLELRLAFEVVAPGGIVCGDDWTMNKEEGDEPVRSDVFRFANEHAAELDNDFGPRVQPWRTLGRARPGLFVSYNSNQWFMRKRPDAVDAAAQRRAADAAKAPSASFECWSDGFKQGDCCDVKKFGPQGNIKCWDLVFTFVGCCPGR